MENKTNAQPQQPAQPATQPVLVQPKEPGFCEEAWEATKTVAGISATAFCVELARAAGITLGACIILKMFGVFDKSNS